MQDQTGKYGMERFEGNGRCEWEEGGMGMYDDDMITIDLSPKRKTGSSLAGQGVETIRLIAKGCEAMWWMWYFACPLRGAVEHIGNSASFESESR
jgi:hypothetical protein